MNERTWHEQMQADLVVAGLAPRTRVAWMRSVRQLRQYHGGTPPQTLTEEQVKDHLLWLRTEKRAAPGTLNNRHRGAAIRLPEHLQTRERS